MDKKSHNQLTLADLKQALTGLATKADLKALAPQETVNTIMETVAEMKESISALKSEVTGRMDTTEGVLQAVVAELNATHDDVRYVRTTVTMLAHTDAAHEAAIESLRKRLERVERKVGITQ